MLYVISVCREHAAGQIIKKTYLQLAERSRAYFSPFAELKWVKCSHSNEATFLRLKQTAKTKNKTKKEKKDEEKDKYIFIYIAIKTSRHVHAFWTFHCYCLFELRLMCTVLEFSSVRFASGNYRILTGATSKLPWWQTACFELSFGDACNKMLIRDQVCKKSLVNSNNQYKIGFEKICFLSILEKEKKT